jgi:hypothetical protein
MIQVALVLIGTMAAMLALFNRRATAYLMLPAIALSPEINVGGLAVRIEDFLMIPFAVGWLMHIAVFKDRQRTSLDKLLIAYVLVAFAGTFWGVHLGTAHLFTLDKYISAPFHLLKRVEFVLLFFILADTLRTIDDCRRYTYVMILSFLGLSVFALVEYLTNGSIAVAPAGAPIHEPGWASVLNIGLALSLLPVARPPVKLLLGALILFSLVVLPLSFGRNFIATTVLLLLYTGIFQDRWVLALLPVPWLIGLLLYPERVIQRILTFQHLLAPDITGAHSQGASLLSRIQSPIFYSLYALGHSPVFGFGPGSIPLGYPDDEYVTQLFYTGLVGLTIFILLGARLFRLAQQTVKAAPDPFSSALAKGLRFALAAYGIYSIFSPSLSATRAGGFFFVTIAVLAALHRATVEAPAQEVRIAQYTSGPGSPHTTRGLPARA